MPSNVQFIRDMLYTLKLDYGAPIKYGRVTRNQIDSDTGLNTVTKVMYPVRRAIVLPTKLNRRFAQDIAYLAANKNFTYGALFDEKITVILIDKRDVPRGLELNMDDFIWMDHQRYVVKSAEILEHNCGWVLTMETHIGQSPFEIQPAVVRQMCQFQQEVAYVLN